MILWFCISMILMGICVIFSPAHVRCSAAAGVVWSDPDCSPPIILSNIYSNHRTLTQVRILLLLLLSYCYSPFGAHKSIHSGGITAHVKRSAGRILRTPVPVCFPVPAEKRSEWAATGAMSIALHQASPSAYLCNCELHGAAAQLDMGKPRQGKPDRFVQRSCKLAMHTEQTHLTWFGRNYWNCPFSATQNSGDKCWLKGPSQHLHFSLS